MRFKITKCLLVVCSVNGSISMKGIKKYTIHLICILSFFTALFYNELNLKYLPDDAKREHQTVGTNDDASYLNPPLNYLTTNTWYEDYYGGKIGYFIRPPGYGLIYLAIYKCVGAIRVLTYLKLLQLLLFSLSVYCFYYIAFAVLQMRRLALFVSALYGLSPFAIGFLYYTLTEGVSPALLLGFVFFLFKANDANTSTKTNTFFFIAALLFSFLFLVRPVLGIFGLLLPTFIIYNKFKTSVKAIAIQIVTFGLTALSLMIVWQVRNYRIAGEYVGLHPVYYADGNTNFRPPFREYWRFAGGWAERGDVGFSYMCPLWDAAITGDTSIRYVNDAIAHFPQDVVQYFGRERLTLVFRKYQESILVQKQYYDKQLPMPMEQPAVEKESTQDFIQLTNEFKSHFWFQYYFSSPFKVFKLMTFHSNLSLFIFQRTFRGTFIMETVRLLFYSIHGLCFLILIFNLIMLNRKGVVSYSLVIAPLTYVYYLCYVQRGIEERYTLPILPFLLIGLAYTLEKMSHWRVKVEVVPDDELDDDSEEEVEEEEK